MRVDLLRVAGLEGIGLVAEFVTVALPKILGPLRRYQRKPDAIT